MEALLSRRRRRRCWAAFTCWRRGRVDRLDRVRRYGWQARHLLGSALHNRRQLQLLLLQRTDKPATSGPRC